MRHSSKQVQFFTSDKGIQTKKLLLQMVDDEAFNTRASFSANKDRYPDSAIPFVDKHLEYLSVHQNIDPNQYIANLRLATKKR